MTREKILEYLERIEREHNVKILFAAETGSRAWGFASPDSDWDVRFVYVHPLEWYLTVKPGRDVIEVMTDEGLDAVGWDMRKALALYSKTNMTFMEWLGSPIIYIDNKELRDQLLSLKINVKRALHHYFSIAVNHQNKYLEKRGVELKRYLYYIRSLLACQWIIENESTPPVPFRELVAHTVSDPEILSELNHILSLKSQSKEHDKEHICDSLRDYGKRLEDEIQHHIGNLIDAKIRIDEQSINHFLYDTVTRQLY